MKTDGGGKVSLSGLKGQNVVLYFYPKDDTSGCTAQACGFRDSLPKFGKIDAAVKQANLAVSHAESIRKFRILPVDFTEDTGELTPTLKVKRKVVTEEFAHDIEAIYTTS